MPQREASVMVACSISSMSSSSPSENFTSQGSPSIATTDLGRAPPMDTPGRMRRRCSSGTGSLARTLCTTSAISWRLARPGMGADGQGT